jgi:hypothetical protein
MWCAGKILQFYRLPRGFLRKVGTVDLLIVDGPPYYYHSREAALYLVYPSLSPRGVLLLDDVNRRNREQVYLENWKRHFRGNIEVVESIDGFNKGLACVRPTGAGERRQALPFFARARDSCVSVGRAAEQGVRHLVKVALQLS